MEKTGVYAAINRVQAAMSVDGIGKDRRNQQQGYNFRGIDDMYNALSPVLAKSGLCILPRVMNRECTERATAKGGVLFNVVCEVEFDFIAADDGSRHTVKTFGEAMDSADKATNKAMSAAYKYAVMQAFAIPTEGDNDADAHTHEVAPRQAPPEDQPKPMPENMLADYLIVIREADAMESLVKTFTNAQRVAREHKDAEALRQIVEAKDKRKAELEGTTEGVPA